MTGFIRGLFGSKKDKNASQVDDLTNSRTKKNDSAFYLDNDSAKTFGDIDYMRTAKAVTKSFPKGLGEVTEVISTYDKNIIDAEEAKKSEAETKAETKIESKAQFGKSDGIASASTNMDMFRKMAKNIKKS